MSKTKLTDKQYAEMTPWDIAKHLGIGYEGDINPVEHGGVFYDTRDWEAFGYASCVEFWYDDDKDVLMVQQGTINRPDDMEPAWRYSGIGQDDEDRGNIHAQISAARAYYGIEPDDYTPAKRFNLDNWPKEWRVWKSVRRWIEALGE